MSDRFTSRVTESFASRVTEQLWSLQRAPEVRSGYVKCLLKATQNLRFLMVIVIVLMLKAQDVLLKNAFIIIMVIDVRNYIQCIKLVNCLLLRSMLLNLLV